MKNKVAIILIILFAGLLYALTIRGVPGNPQPATIKSQLEQSLKPFELSPERGRFAHVMALVDTHTYALNQQMADFVMPDVGYYKGKFFSFFAPGVAYMAMPFYWIGEQYNLSQVSTFSLVSIFAILAMIFIFRICRDIFKLPIWASILAPLIFAFGCTSWSYAITLYEHMFSTFFIIFGFYAVWRYKQQTSLSWIWGLGVWAAYALSWTVDYPNALLMLPVMVYFLFAALQIYKAKEGLRVTMRASFLLTALVFVAISALHGYQNNYYFGSWKNLAGTLPGYHAPDSNHLLTTSDPAGTDIDAEATKTVAGFFSEDHLPFSFYTLLVSPDRGLFLYAPIFLLGLFGIYYWMRNINLEYGVLCALMAVNLFLYSSWGDPWGGWAYGPRYLIPSMAVLSIALVTFLARMKYGHAIVTRIATFILLAYSSAIALAGALTSNAIPPEVEGDFLHIRYNFLQNFIYLRTGRSGSFLYNTYFSGTLTLMQYAICIYAVLLIVFVILLFVIPKLSHES